MLRPEWRWLVCNRLVTVTGVAMVVAAGLSACGQAQTVPRKAARLTIDGVTHTTRPATCSQEHSYRTIDIRNHDSTVQAVVLLSGDRVIPQWVKIRNVDGFNGSFWHGGVGNARADRARNTYTVAGSAYGISSKNPTRWCQQTSTSSPNVELRVLVLKKSHSIDGGAVKDKLHWLAMHGVIRGIAAIGIRRGDLQARLIADPAVATDPVPFTTKSGPTAPWCATAPTT